MKNKLAVSTSLLALMALSGCQEYLVRSDLVSPYSGDAVARNVSNQTIDPWPRYVNNTDFKTSGERQAGAIRKYNEIHDEETGQAQVIQLTPTPAPSE